MRIKTKVLVSFLSIYFVMGFFVWISVNELFEKQQIIQELDNLNSLYDKEVLLIDGFIDDTVDFSTVLSTHKLIDDKILFLKEKSFSDISTFQKIEQSNLKIYGFLDVSRDQNMLHLKEIQKQSLNDYNEKNKNILSYIDDHKFYDSSNKIINNYLVSLSIENSLLYSNDVLSDVEFKNKNNESFLLVESLIDSLFKKYLSEFNTSAHYDIISNQKDLVQKISPTSFPLMTTKIANSVNVLPSDLFDTTTSEKTLIFANSVASELSFLDISNDDSKFLLFLFDVMSQHQQMRFHADLNIMTKSDLQNIVDIDLKNQNTQIKNYVNTIKSDQLNQIDFIKIKFLIIFFILLIGVALFGIVLSRSLSNPLEKLQSNALLLESGDYSSNLTTSSSDEIGDLTKSFNSMRQKLWKSETELKSVIESKQKESNDIISSLDSSSFLIVLDSSGHIMSLNNQFMKKSGSSQVNFVGRLLGDLLDDSSLLDPILISAHRGEVWHGTLKFNLPVTFWMNVSVLPLFDGHSSPQRYLLIGVDITQEIEDLNLKKEFIDLAAHELRTPIQPLMNYVKLLKSGTISQDDALDGMSRSVTRLKILVDDILTVSMIESNSLKYSMIHNNIKNIIQTVVKSKKTLLKQKNIVVTVDVDDCQVPCDSEKIKLVFSNIIENSIKYGSDMNKIKIVSEIKGSFFNISVIDSGYGIPKRMLPRLFSRFVTMNPTSGPEGGSGLGLYICKKIVNAHNGSISGFNNSDSGSTFIVSLPLTGKNISNTIH